MMELRFTTRTNMLPAILAMFISLIHTASANLSPQFTNWASTSPLWVNEDTVIGSVIGQVMATDDDSGLLTFSVVGESANQLLQLIRVGDKTMNITLKRALDREVVPDYEIGYEVTDGVNKVRKTGFLYVIDVNDNPPHFTNLPYRAQIPEDSPVGSFVYKVTASDPDLSHSGLVNYNIQTPQGTFLINIADGNVTLNQTLDYETKSIYQLEIIAIDSGDPIQLNSTTDLIINVMDVQDTAPYFLNLPYIESINENTTVGTTILTVSALDGDRGVPNQVNYTFAAGNEDSTSYFTLDPLSGAIVVAFPLDREDPDILAKSGVLDFTVITEEITLTPQGPTMASAPVTIRIVDVNDETPTFSQPEYEATVYENTQNRIPVNIVPDGTELIVTDFDAGNNGRFELYLERDGQVFNVFEPYPSTVINEANILLRVKNSTALDYERVTSYTFDIVAMEYATPQQLSGRAKVTVYIEDINDNWPVFPEIVYNADIPENPFNNTPVIRVTATDADSGSYGEITYSLRGVQAHLFRIDTDGFVLVNVDADEDESLLDREKQDVLFLTVEAQDGDGLRSTSQLEVRLTDQNDNAPRILRDQYEAYVYENAYTLNTPVVIQAEDLDLGPLNNLIVYSITGGNPYNNFTINPSNGSLGLNRFALNYEAMAPDTDGIFNLTVQARDMGQYPLASTTRVIVYVLDVNDEIPFFMEPNYFSVLPENSTGGTNVSLVSAQDRDGTAPNNQIIYRIQTGGKDKFRINADTGLITVETGADLDRDDYGVEYDLKVVAIDKGTPSLTGEVDVKVIITDVNNKMPIFLEEPNIRVSEGLAVGDFVYPFDAFDPDETAELRYTLLDEVTGVDEEDNPVDDIEYLRNLFRVNAVSGSIYVNSTLNREVVEKLTLLVLAEDINAEMPEPVQTTTGTVKITITDVNDNPPLFTPSDVYHAQVSETSQPGVEVTRVTAVDLDEGGAGIRYYILYDTVESEAFEITDANRNLGVITLRQSVDREKFDFINITVQASDSGIPPLNSTAKVHIEIEDFNDNSPDWQVFNTTVSVWENATVGTELTFVRAVDMDSGEFGHVMYFIINGGFSMFSVNNETGIVSVVYPLDREETSSYFLNFEARDNNFAPPTEQRKTPGTMHVVVNDVNDNIPQFKHPFYTGMVPENVNQNTPVTRIEAADADSGKNGIIDFSVNNTASNVTGLFNVNMLTGQVYVSGSLQGQDGTYIMVVVAQDRGSPTQLNTTIVYIDIVDVNDHLPEIYHPEENETIFIRENINIGTLIRQVLAVDNDFIPVPLEGQVWFGDDITKGTGTPYWENVDIGTLVMRVLARDDDAGQNGIVNYRFTKSDVIEDWRKFTINTTSGEIFTAAHMDREDQETYTLEVVAYDLGALSLEDRRTLTVVLRDMDDNPPMFDRVTVPVPHIVSVVEEVSNTHVADLNLAQDPDHMGNAVICYFIVGGDVPYRDQFVINRTSGELRLNAKLDRETVPTVVLIIKATDYCMAHPGMDIPWNVSDWSLLLVHVKPSDVNDNSPRFKKRWFTAGVTKDTQHGAEVINLKQYTLDPDEGNNAVVQYRIQGPFRFSDGLGGQFDEPPFVIGGPDGVVYTNVYFQENMQGYIEFEVVVTDPLPSHLDKANVSVYLLVQEQRVKVIILGDTEEVQEFKDIFASFLSNITKAIINVDMLQTHKDANGDPDTTRTDMFIHGIIPSTGEVMDAKVLIELIDNNYASLVDLFKQYNVIEIVPAVEEEADTVTEKLQLALILVAIILGLLTVILIVAFCVWHRKSKRKLKAATAMAYDVMQHPKYGHVMNSMENKREYEEFLAMYIARQGSPQHDTGLNKSEMPGTNVHAYEGINELEQSAQRAQRRLTYRPMPTTVRGSNPIWLEQYDQGWPKDSDTESKDSLDENAFEPPRGPGFDEQEMSMEMYNDEYDNFNKVPNSRPLHDSDAYLKAALREHQAAQGNNLNQSNHRPRTNGTANGSVQNVYDNVSFQPDVLPSFEGLESTEI